MVLSSDRVNCPNLAFLRLIADLEYEIRRLLCQEVFMGEDGVIPVRHGEHVLQFMVVVNHHLCNSFRCVTNVTQNGSLKLTRDNLNAFYHESWLESNGDHRVFPGVNHEIPVTMTTVQNNAADECGSGMW